MMLDIIVRNASIVDGSGEKMYVGDIGVKDGKFVSDVAGTGAAYEIDATGKLMTPGFIDSHSHMDALLGKMDEVAAIAKINQGVTTEITGQCGESRFPLVDTDEYFREMKRIPKVGNYAFMCGHSAIREKVMQMNSSEPTKDQLQLMKDYVKRGMENGAFGMTSGLIYVPGVYAKEEELIELCKVIHEYDGIYATHMRSESDNIIPAVKEAIDVAEKADTALVISHHKICGKQNWGSSKETLRLVHDAINRGMRITIDQYPYEASQTVLSTSIPPEYFTDGYDVLCSMLKDNNVREKIRQRMTAENIDYNCGYRNAGGFGGILVVSAPKTKEAEGLTIEEYAKKTGKDPFDAYFDIIAANGKDTGAIYFVINPGEINAIYLDENTVVGSDSNIFSADGPVHPRAYATFVRSLHHFVKEEKIISLEKAVYKQTFLTAQRWGIKNKGLIKDGYDADFLLLDYDRLEDRAVYTDGRRLCDGVDEVYVAGTLVYKDKKLTGAKPGKCVLKER